MKAIRLVALAAALLAVGTVAAGAQAAPQQGQGRGQGRQAVPPGIELTDAQKAQLAEIEKKYQPEMAALGQQRQNGGNPAEIMKKAREIREKQQTDVRAILTPEQQSVFDKYAADMRARMEQMQRQAPPAR